MIEKGVLEQVVLDGYSLKFKQTSYTQDIIAQNTKAMPLIEQIVRDYPQGVALDVVRAQLSEQHDMKLDRVQCNAILLQLHQLGLTFPSNNLWYHADYVSSESQIKGTSKNS
jgi:hypothetical protein